MEYVLFVDISYIVSSQIVVEQDNMYVIYAIIIQLG